MVNVFCLWIWINVYLIVFFELSVDIIENVRLGIIKLICFSLKCIMNLLGLLNLLVMVILWFRKFNLGMKLLWYWGSGLNVY